ncbi:DUF2786 domain-containing protein [Klenkia taihuensis]|uniref:Uncharacterized protein n=1 Tax=Klenkia taihuensis TaxID=1225127 RepID=A0A1I1UR66_9ACTN|nr:DUF2786 domain-containing protein [Klenkia taihuensis]GHE13919.1 hypothetical protein GCM10011381_38090 [Klenkia taihuensis]SFD73194.1 Protein of unknown function [Klenkia taihuensis]
MRTPWRPAAEPDPAELLRAAVAAARLPGATADLLDPLTTALAARHPALDLPGVEQQLTAAVAGLWDRGWQPADVVHVVGRRTSRRAARLVAAVVRSEAAASGAADRAPRPWVEQLDALPPAVGVPGWRAGTRVEAGTAWADVVRVLALLPTLPPLERLLPGPAGWPAHRRAGEEPVRSGPVDERVLGRVRALLAKAERTDFPEEADALAGKAQELVSRYAIDAAVLAGEQALDLGAGVVARRLHLDDPFATAKSQLLHAVAAANGCRVVRLGDLGMATVVGLPTDLELVDLLFTSLLLQATRALADAGRGGPRSAVFGRGFLLAYAGRIGERLTAAGERAATAAAAEHGGALVPALARRDAAVEHRLTELFPRLRAARRRAVDPAGWWAGRAAADRADLGSGPAAPRLGR